MRIESSVIPMVQLALATGLQQLFVLNRLDYPMWISCTRQPPEGYNPDELCSILTPPKTHYFHSGNCDMKLTDDLGHRWNRLCSYLTEHGDSVHHGHHNLLPAQTKAYNSLSPATPIYPA